MSTVDSAVFVVVLLFLSASWWRWTRFVRTVRPWDSFGRTGRTRSLDPARQRSWTTAAHPQRAYLEAAPPPFPAIRAVVTMALVMVALWIVSSAGEPGFAKHWGYALLGLVVGYWLPRQE